jgi:hypothetical protein
LSAIGLTIFMTFTACKKESKSNTDTSTDPNATELTVQADDQARVSSELDATGNDANGVLEADANMSGKLDGVICDAAVTVNTTGNQRTVTITYDSSSCAGSRYRKGVIILSMASGVYWKDTGAVLTITYQNLKITRKSDKKSITINGTETITNVSGGLLKNLSSLRTITHTISSNNMLITFDDGSQRTWQVARKRVFTYNNGIVITITGNHTDGTNTNIAEWGTDRFGKAFATSITQPLVIRQECDFRLTAGEIKHSRPSTSSTVTFGLDANGNPTTCPGQGSFYYKVSWTGPGGRTYSAILPY